MIKRSTHAPSLPLNWMPMQVNRRQREPEWMDQPDLDVRLHEEALQGLRRVNRISRSVVRLWRKIATLAAASPARPLRVLDVACGGGDTAIGLWRRARQAGIPLEVAGCDVSPTAVAVARQAAEVSQSPVEFWQADVLRDPLPDRFDVICCSLFLHHLEEEMAVHLLRSMRQAARRMILVDDLIRSWQGYWMAWLGIRLLTRSKVCHMDGPLSVQGAFTPPEALRLAEQAGLEGVRLSTHWPQRFLLCWSRHD